MKAGLLESKDIFLGIPENELLEIIPGFIPDKKAMLKNIRTTPINTKNKLEDIQKNIVHLELCLARIKNSVKNL